MTQAMYVSASAMNALAGKQDVIANNLANANTDGYKSDVAVFKSFKETYDESLGFLGGGIKLDDVSHRFEQGALAYTGNPLNAAITGNAMFAVMTPKGERYTRSGNFSLNQSGELVTGEGYAVVGEGGTLKIEGGNVAILADGSVSVDGAVVGKMKTVGFQNSADLTKEGQNLYAFKSGVAPGPVGSDVTVSGGYIEKSDVDSVREMVSMIALQRAYELNQKSIVTADDTLRQAISLGKQ